MITYRFEYIEYRATGLRSLFLKKVIRETTIHIKSGKTTAIVGKTGSGKTSVLYRLGLIENNHWDRYNLNGVDINLDSESEKAYYRASKIAYVYQDNNLFEDFTLLENFEMIQSISQVHHSIEDYLKLVGLEEELLTHQVSTLSGGEKQRAALALALIKEPELLLLDEPTSKLDDENKEMIITLLRKIQKKTKVTIVLVTHDKSVADSCDEIMIVENQTVHPLKTIEEDQQVTPKELPPSHPPKGYIRKTFYSHFASYSSILLIMSILLSLSEIISYAGNQLLKDQAQAISSIPDTYMLVVNQASDEVHIQNTTENEFFTKEECDSIIENDHLELVLPLFYSKEYLVVTNGNNEELMELYHNSKLSADEFIEYYDSNYMDGKSCLIPYYIMYLPEDYFTEHIQMRVSDLIEQSFDANAQENSYYALSDGFKELIQENASVIKSDEGESLSTVTYVKEGENSAYAFYEKSNEYGYNTGNDHYAASAFTSKLTKGSSSISYTTNNYANILNTFEDLGTDNLFSDMDYVVYQSIASISDLDSLGFPNENNHMYAAASAYLVKAKDYHHLNEVAKELESVSDTIGVRYDHHTLSYYDEVLLHLDTFMNIFYILLVPLVLLGVILLIYKYIHSRVYDFVLLKTYGLDQEMVHSIFRKTFASAFIIVYIISSLLTILASLLLMVIGIADWIQAAVILGVVLVFGIISYLYAMVYVEYTIDHIDPGTILKNN